MEQPKPTTNTMPNEPEELNAYHQSVVRKTIKAMQENEMDNEISASICNVNGECHGEFTAHTVTEAILIAACELQRIADVLEALERLANSINWNPQD